MIGVSIAQLAVLGVQTGLQIVQLLYTWHLMNSLLNGEWLLKQARKFGFQFDKILIKYSEQIYGYFQKIVKGTLITPSVTNSLMNRIYVVIGLFIFFKIAMIAMKYMVNPEMFQDDKLGAQTLVKRVIIGSIIIILTPLIFKTASELQSSIIEDRVIEKIILPKDIYSSLIKRNDQGKNLAMLVFKGFFGWNDAIPTSKNKKIYDAYDRVLQYNDVSSFSNGYITEQSGNDYYISYIPIISTLAVGYLLFMLIKFSMEVAFRALKMFLLQIMSPFVIVNYMLDPSKEEVMKKWINTTISTYLMIFIRVITLWLATLIAYYLTNGIPLQNGETSLLNDPDPLLKSLIVLAVFAFLKDLPKVISNIFGYDFQENETISGIMNQGVGVLKGFAMAKVGSSFVKKQLALSSASGILGTASGALGGINEGLSATKNNRGAGSPGSGSGGGAAGAGGAGGGASGSRAFGVIGTIAGGVGSANVGLSSINRTTGQAVSSVFGSTVLSPISGSASMAGSEYTGPPPSARILEERPGGKPNQKVHNENLFTQDFRNDISTDQSLKNSNYVNAAGDQFDLSVRVQNDPKTGQPATWTDIHGNIHTVEKNSPVVEKMATQIISQLPAGSSKPTRDQVIERINNEVKFMGSESASHASLDDIGSIMDNVHMSFTRPSPSPGTPSSPPPGTP